MEGNSNKADVTFRALLFLSLDHNIRKPADKSTFVCFFNYKRGLTSGHLGGIEVGHLGVPRIF